MKTSCVPIPYSIYTPPPPLANQLPYNGRRYTRMPTAALSRSRVGSSVIGWELRDEVHHRRKATLVGTLTLCRPNPAKHEPPEQYTDYTRRVPRLVPVRGHSVLAGVRV